MEDTCQRTDVKAGSQFTPGAPPICPVSGRVCNPAVTWEPGNFCRALVLLPYIAATPGLSNCDLSQRTSLPRGQVRTGLVVDNYKACILVYHFPTRNYPAPDSMLLQNSSPGLSVAISMGFFHTLNV